MRSHAVGPPLLLLGVEFGPPLLVPRLVLFVEHVQFGFQTFLVVRAVAVEVGVVLEVVVVLGHLFNLVVGIVGGVDAGRLSLGDRIETSLGLDPRQREEVHLARLGGAFFVLPVETDRRSLALLRLDLRLLLLVPSSPGVHRGLQRLHLVHELIVLVHLLGLAVVGR